MKPEMENKIKAARELQKQISRNGMGSLIDYQPFDFQPGAETFCMDQVAESARWEVRGVAFNALEKYVKQLGGHMKPELQPTKGSQDE